MSISISGNGVITGATTSYSFDQSVSIGGTLTYEDVTNIDSVGVITARSGIKVPGGSVAIGLDTTQAPLHVKSSVARASIVESTSTDGSYASFVDPNTSSYDRVQIGSAGNDLVLRTTEVERMRIDSAGRVAIGTDATVYPLRVLNETNNFLQFSKTGDSVAGSLIGRVNVTDELRIQNSENAPISFLTNNAERLRIDSAGHVLLGKTTTSITTVGNRLSSGLISISASSTSSNFAANAGGALNLCNTNATNNNFSNIGGYNSNGLVVSQIDFINVSHAGRTGDISFLTHNGTSMSERMRISNTGNVAIGNADPGTMLHIADSTDDGTFRLGGNNAGNTGFNIQYENGGTTYTILKQNYASTNSNAYTSVHTGFFTVNTGSSLAERFRVDAAGYLQASPTGNYYGSGSNFHSFTNNVSGQWVLGIRNQHTTPYGVRLFYDSAAPNNSGSEFFYASDTGGLRFAVTSNGGVWNYQSNNVNLSDEREKKNIETLDSTWSCLKNWDLKKFHYNADSDTDDKRYGVIAQQVEPHCPEVVSDWVVQKAEDAVLDEEGNVVTPAKEEILRKGVKEQQMMWMTIKALQEAQTRIETLEAEVQALKGN